MRHGRRLISGLVALVLVLATLTIGAATPASAQELPAGVATPMYPAGACPNAHVWAYKWCDGLARQLPGGATGRLGMIGIQNGSTPWLAMWSPNETPVAVPGYSGSVTVCVLMTDATYRTMQIGAGEAPGVSFMPAPDNDAGYWRGSGTNVGALRPSGWYLRTTGACGDGAPDYQEPAKVATPWLACHRTLNVDPNGASGTVKAGAVTTNPTSDATDVFSWRFPWEGQWRTGPVQTSQLPSLASMPAGGWRAQCRVVRTRKPDTTASTRWTQLPAASEVVDCEAGDDECYAREAGWGGTEYVGAAGYAGLGLTAVKLATPQTASALALSQELINEYNLRGVTSPAAAKPPPAVSSPSLWSRVGGVAAVAGAGVVGYLAGGVLASAGLDTALGMDLSWLCNNNPGYAALNKAKCADQKASQESLRSDTQLQTTDGTTATRTAPGWDKATATAEVLIDPTRPAVGASNAAGVEDPWTNPDGTPGALATPAAAAAIEVVANDPEAVPNAAAEDIGQDDGSCPTGFGILNPFAFGKLMRCLFIPTNLTAASIVGDSCATSFPCSWMQEGNAAVQLVHGDLTGGLGGNACGPSIGFALPASISAAAGRAEFRAQLPTPAGSGCVGNGSAGERTADDDKVGDLFGWRNTFRSVLRFLLALGFFALMISQAPWSKQRDFTFGKEGTAAEPQGTMFG